MPWSTILWGLGKAFDRPHQRQPILCCPPQSTSNTIELPTYGSIGNIIVYMPFAEIYSYQGTFPKQLKPKGKKYGQTKLGNRKSQYSGVGPRGKIGPLMEMYLMETKIHTTTIHYLIFCPGPAVQTAAVHKLSIVSDI